MIELALGMAVLALVAGAVTPVAVRYVRQEAGAKTAREILAVLDAGRTFYVATNRWPTTLAELRAAGHLPTGFAQSPFGGAYAVTISGTLFEVSVSVPSELASGVVRLVPLASATAQGATALVSAAAAVPGTNADTASLLHRQGTLAGSTMLGPLDVVDQSATGTPNIRSRGVAATNVFEGRVGVGATAPQASLEIPSSNDSSQGVWITDASASYQPRVQLFNSGSGGGALRLTDLANDQTVALSAQGSGGQQLSIAGPTAGMRLASSETNGRSWIVRSAGDDGGSLRFIDATSNAVRGQFNGGGDFYASGGGHFSGGRVDVQLSGTAQYRVVDQGTLRASNLVQHVGGNNYEYRWYLADSNVLRLQALLSAGGNLYLRGGVTNGGLPDVAEYVRVGDPTIEAGDLVALDAEANRRAESIYDRMVVRKTQMAYDRHIAGAISPGGGMVLNGGHDVLERGGRAKPGYQLLALAGRIPIKVSSENGPLRAGDRVVASSLPGVGMRANDGGVSVGMAAEPFDGRDGVERIVAGRRVRVRAILVLVNLAWIEGEAPARCFSLAVPRSAGALHGTMGDIARVASDRSSPPVAPR